MKEQKFIGFSKIETTDLNLVQIFITKYKTHAKTNNILDVSIIPIMFINEKKLLSEYLNLETFKKNIIKSLCDNVKNSNLEKILKNYTYKIGKIIRLAELNADNLNLIVRQYLNVFPIEEVLERNATCRECKQYSFDDNLNKLTFSNLKKIFICIINTDQRLHVIEELNTKDKRKEFSKIYNTFIENRNYFTHGKIFFLENTIEPVLRVKIDKSEEILKFEKTFYKKNIDVFTYIEEILEEVLKILNIENTNIQIS